MTYSIVFVSHPHLKEAEKLGLCLVKEKLAACVHLFPEGVSVYAWEGKLCRAREVLMMIKTKKALFEKLSIYIKHHHPYKTPEVIMASITKGNRDYLKWMDDALKSKKRK